MHKNYSRSLAHCLKYYYRPQISKTAVIEPNLQSSYWPRYQSPPHYTSKQNVGAFGKIHPQLIVHRVRGISFQQSGDESPRSRTIELRICAHPHLSVMLPPTGRAHKFLCGRLCLHANVQSIWAAAETRESAVTLTA